MRPAVLPLNYPRWLKGVPNSNRYVQSGMMTPLAQAFLTKDTMHINYLII